jgi:hypothetical protein
MPAPKGDVFVANTSFSAQRKAKKKADREVLQVHAGATRVRKGHWLLDQCPKLFDPVDDGVTYEVEQATAAPGEKRGQKAGQ